MDLQMNKVDMGPGEKLSELTYKFSYQFDISLKMINGWNVDWTNIED